MALDLAIDFDSGDLIFAPNFDLATRQGSDTVEQRIRVRVRVIAGSWDIDPTLGSNIRDALRMPIDMALQMIPLLVKEALAPMDDITVQDVECSVNPESANIIDMVISYAMVADPSGTVIRTSISTLSEGVS